MKIMASTAEIAQKFMICDNDTVRSESHCAPAILKQERYPVF